MHAHAHVCVCIMLFNWCKFTPNHARNFRASVNDASRVESVLRYRGARQTILMLSMKIILQTSLCFLDFEFVPEERKCFLRTRKTDSVSCLCYMDQGSSDAINGDCKSLERWRRISVNVYILSELWFICSLCRLILRNAWRHVNHLPNNSLLIF